MPLKKDTTIHQLLPHVRQIFQLESRIAKIFEPSVEDEENYTFITIEDLNELAPFVSLSIKPSFNSSWSEKVNTAYFYYPSLIGPNIFNRRFPMLALASHLRNLWQVNSIQLAEVGFYCVGVI